jgi:hypothetical protein
MTRYEAYDLLNQVVEATTANAATHRALSEALGVIKEALDSIPNDEDDDVGPF